MLARSVLLCGAILLSAGSSTQLETNLPTKVDPDDGEVILRNHLLVYNGNCAATDRFITDRFEAMTPHDHAFRTVLKADDKLSELLGIDSCERVICLEQGTPLSSLRDYQETYDVDEDANQRTFSRWFTHNCQHAEVGFLSYHDHDINVEWVDALSGNRHPQGTISYGERHTMWRTSFLGHRFILTDSVTGDVVLDYSVPFTGIYVIGDYVLKTPSEAEIKRFEKEIEGTFKFEWERSRSIKRRFTERGFEKAWIKDLQPYVWGSVRAYYYNNKDHGVAREEWDNKGLYVNWWESEPQIMPLPWGRKTMWHNGMMPIEEQWIGGETPLERSDIYGIRIYNKGARLLSHVDRIETHAASMILNIAQINVTKPWLVEIYDHSDHLHEIEMNPGNIVYYESAACLHARMNPLANGKYVNMFIHYRPVGDPQWFQKPNPRAPTPLTTASHIEPFVGESNLPKKSSEDSSQPSLDCSSHEELDRLLEKESTTPQEKKQIEDLWRKSCKRVEQDGTRIHLDPLQSHHGLMEWWKDGLSDLAAVLQSDKKHSEL